MELDALEELSHYSEGLFDEGPEYDLKSFLVNTPSYGPRSGFEHDYPNRMDSGTGPQKNELSDKFGGLSSHAIGSWPQRLLHVPTMTSYEWTTGNIYGNHVAPKYNAISYTWGRFDIDLAPGKSDKMTLRKTKSIKIGGIPWAANIPRIDPDHFRVTEFQNVIARTLNLCDSDGIEFVWLDIACIDQRNGPQKAAEIGRQAAIFKGAKNVFIWLTRLDSSGLKEILGCLQDSSGKSVDTLTPESLDGRFGSPWRLQLTNPLRTIKTSTHMSLTEIYVGSASEEYRSLNEKDMQGQALDREMPWLKTTRTMLDAMFMDPWFTSLWTLQEAFLCPRAFLLSREAVVPAATIADLCQWCATIHKACDILSPQGLDTDIAAEFEGAKIRTGRRKYIWEIEQMVLCRGLLALASRSPMALYAAAFYRKTRNENDRVYAIQQVFDLQLGSSAPGHANQPVHPVLLENELGAKILELYPVLSQLHVFTQPVESGRGWRMSGSSSIPDPGLNQNLADFRYISTCILKTQRAGNLQWGYFSGRICPFEDMRQAWVMTPPPSPISEGANAWKSPQWIALDVFDRPWKPDCRWIPPALVELGSNGCKQEDLGPTGFPQTTPTGDAQHGLALSMIQGMDEWYKNKELVVLYLAHFYNETSHDLVRSPVLYRVGLILVESEFKDIAYWRRLGFCIWTCVDPSDYIDMSQDTLRSSNILTVSNDCQQWREESGRFG